jgi:hypothetical protein
VGRTPWSAADTPVGLLAPCKMLMSLFRQRDEDVRPQRGPQDQGVRPTKQRVVFRPCPGVATHFRLESRFPATGFVIMKTLQK